MAAASLQQHDTPHFREYFDLLQGAGVADMLVTKPPLGVGDALLVIDMQNDFIPSSSIKQGGRFAVAEGDLVAPLCAHLITETMSKGGCVIATRDYHPVDHCSFSTHSGPFPPHCVQGTTGSKLYPSVATAMSAAIRLDEQRASIAFKGMHEDIDSFGALPYLDGGEGRIMRRGNLCTEAYTGCTAAPWTGCLLLKCSALSFDGDIDVDAPPDMLAIHHGESRGCVQNIVAKLMASGARRLFVCGLALDFCVCDTALNASAAGFDDVAIVLDAARPAYLDGIGTFGSGFLSDPVEFLAKLRNAGVTFTSTMSLTGRRLPLPAAVPGARMNGSFPEALGPFGLTRASKLDIRMLGDFVSFQVNFRGSMRPLSQYCTDGYCTPFAAVTLPAEARANANIPAAATSFSYAYPLPGINNMDAGTRSLFLSSNQDPNWRFICYGGFLYFNEEGYVLAANAIGPGASISFGPPEPWRSGYTAALIEQNRFQPVTLTDVLSAGARHFAWLHAGETLLGTYGPWEPSAHGAFVYLFHDDPTEEHPQDVFFQVVA